MKKFSLFLLFLLPLLPTDSLSAQPIRPPKREMRGVWVASVANIDFPLKPTTDTAQLKKEWLTLLDGFAQHGLNAVYVQIRPAADALYATPLAPWSVYLSGKQGQALQGGWDPLPFLIETAHARNMEFHAWLNPYRASNEPDTTRFSPQHVFHTHRDWILYYGKKYYLNPALPKVWQHLCGVVKDIVARYNVDAIHMDDYFYPYKVAGEVFPDSADFLRYGQGFAHVDDWRRHNVDTLIQMLRDTIKQTKPHVEFGISPFSVWRNQSKDPEGSPTRAGQTNYDDLYADIRKWLKEGWIDYVAPQLYFPIGFDLVDYEKTLNWWHDNAYGKKLYIGMAAYRIGSDRSPDWQQPDQMPRQLRINHAYPKVDGVVYFSAKQLLKNPLGFGDSLRTGFYRDPALWPLRSGAAANPLPAPVLKKARRSGQGIHLNWEWPQNPAGLSHVVVYRFPKGMEADTETPGAIHRILPAAEILENGFLDQSGLSGQKYRYRLSALNRDYVESPPSNILNSKRFP